MSDSFSAEGVDPFMGDPVTPEGVIPGPACEDPANDGDAFDESSFVFDETYDYDHGNAPAGPGTTLTKGQLLSLVLAFYFRFGWSKVCLDSVLRLLNMLSPECVPKNRYYLNKKFFDPKCKVDTHFKCPRCDFYLGTSGKVVHCSRCNKSYKTDDLFKECSYFLTSAIEEQLREMLENSNLWEHVQENKSKGIQGGSFGEIFTGKSYQKQGLQTFLQGGNNISVSFSTDGVRVSKSSALEIWPIFLTINEVTFTLKSKFLMMSSLWFGQRKPSTDTFLKPFVDEMVRLFNDGFSWTRNGITHTTKVATLIGIFDAPAKASMVNFKQYNGKFGCTYCYHPGVRTVKGNGFMRSFPWAYPLPRERTHKATVEYATQVVSENLTDLLGVKGPSRLYLLKDCGLDIIRGIVPDYMHCVLLGVTDQFLGMWLNSVDADFYIKKASILDQVLLSVKPPNEIRRTPRSMEKFLALWKASEFRNWLLFYSVIALKSILPSTFYNHWLYLVNTMHILLQREINAENLSTCRILIRKFIEAVPELYSDSFCTYNVHSLTHLVDYVEKWGAPWAWSSFLTEDAGGRLKNFFHGTTYIGKQIFETFLASKSYREYARAYMPHADEEVVELFEELDEPLSCDHLYLKDCFAPLGKRDRIKLRASERIAIEDLRAVCHCKNAFSYDRFGINGKLLSTSKYCERFKRNNSVVTLLPMKNRDVFVEITGIYLVSKTCNCLEDSAQNCELLSTEQNLMPIVIGTELICSPVSPVIDNESGLNLTAFVRKLDTTTPSSESIAFNPTEIVNKCILITGHDDQIYCIENKIRFEKD